MEEAADPVHVVVRLPEAGHVLLLARVDDALLLGLNALPAVRADRERAAVRHDVEVSGVACRTNCLTATLVLAIIVL